MEGETMIVSTSPLLTSTTTGKLASALAKAQGMMDGAKKDANNPFFRSKYADLASVWDACREALSTNDLSVIQPPSTKVGGEFTVPATREKPSYTTTGADVSVTTRLMHSSDEWIEATTTTRTSVEAQAIGSAITYLRRYALSGMVGIAPEDDDGEAAQGRPNPNDRGFTRGAQEGLAHIASRPGQATPQNTQPAPPARPPAPPNPSGRLKQVAIDNGLEPAEVPPILDACGFPRLAKDLTEAQFKHLEEFALVNAGRIKRGEAPLPEVNPDGSTNTSEVA